MNLPLVTILLLLIALNTVLAGPPPGHRGHHLPINPEWKRWSMEIQEKVCSGKTTEQQLNDLTKCIETLKAETENQEQLNKNVEECLKETETDIGFTVDDGNKEAVYMICSGKFRMCMHQKMRDIHKGGPPPPPAGAEAPPSGSENNDQSPPPPPKGGRDPEKFERMMQCKREALEIV